MSNNSTKTALKADSNTDALNLKTKHLNSLKMSQIPSYQYYLTSGNKTIRGSSSSQQNYQQEGRPEQLCLPKTIPTDLINNSEKTKKDGEINRDVNDFNKTSPFMQRKLGTAPKILENARKESMFSSIGLSIIRNLKTSPFTQKKSQTPPNRSESVWKVPNSQVSDIGHTNTFDTELIQQSPIDIEKKSHLTFNSPSCSIEARSLQHPSITKGNQSPILLQRFYHQQNQFREKERLGSDCSTNPFINNSYDLNCQSNFVANSTNRYPPSTSSQSSKHIAFYTSDGKNYSIPTINDSCQPNNNLGNSQSPSLASDYSTFNTSDFLENVNERKKKNYEQFTDSHQKGTVSISNNEYNPKNEYGLIKRQFSSCIKRQLDSSQQMDEFNQMSQEDNSRKLSWNSEMKNSGKTIISHNGSAITKSTITAKPYYDVSNSTEVKQRCYVQSPTPHFLTNVDRRHRSPDPPPRYNRGQSPLLLRKNLLELSGQPPGSPLLLNRHLINASPPLPPPRRGSESVPGSPQHFRTRIHYTPEPQRRIYRTIDQ